MKNGRRILTLKINDMSNKLFLNAISRTSQSTPPIWFMRQAGRYHSHYQKLKEKYSFEQLCKNPELASEVACGPINEFDFDVAILFSDILFPLQGLGLPLHFNPGPIFEKFIDENNYLKYSNIDKALENLRFQEDAIKLTKEKLPANKSLIGFVGGLWTLLNFAVNKKKPIDKIESFHLDFMETILLPLISKNIELQLNAGAEIVMIFDSNLQNMNSIFFKTNYIKLIEKITNMFPNKIGYYFRGKQLEDIELLFSAKLAGIGIDKNINISNFFKKYQNGFIQGNFDENKMLLDKQELSEQIDIFCDIIKENNDFNGWVCGLGHGINKKTPEKNVHFFLEKIRKKFT